MVEVAGKTGELRPFRPHIADLGGVVGSSLRFRFRVDNCTTVYTEDTGFLPAYQWLLPQHTVQQARGRRMVESWRKSREARMMRGNSTKMNKVKMYCWLITLMEVYKPYVRVQRSHGQASIIKVVQI